MAVAGTVDVALDIFGGLVTDMAPADLPAGVSPDCQDVAFVPGSVKTRPGLQSMFAAIAGAPAINYLKTYVPPTGLLRLLALDAAGSLWKESSIGVLSLISSAIVPGSYGKSTSLFTREYIATGDGKYGIDIPRQFDDTNLDRVSQVGPGASPTVTDEVSSFSLAGSPSGIASISNTIVASPNGLSESGSIVTIVATAALPTGLQPGDLLALLATTNPSYIGTAPYTIVSVNYATNTITATNSSVPAGLAPSGGGTINFEMAVVTLSPAATPFGVGQAVTFAGVTNALYNSTWTVRSVNAGVSFNVAVSFTGASGSGSGTASASGNISAGVHQLSVAFITRQGYITAPSPPVSWTAGGGKRASIVNIPIGPTNVIARVLLFTLAGQDFFFYSSGIPGIFSSNLIIQDNTTTTVTVDFTDSGLSEAISADFLFKLVELGECSGVTDYGSRLFWWGERNKVENFNNLSFDGGHTFDSVGFIPLGWTRDPTSGSGLSLASFSVWGEALAIVGDGVTAIRGLISQSAYQDAFGVPILSANTSYSARVRLRANILFNTGTFHIKIKSVSGGFTTAGLSVNASQLTLNFQEFIAEILPVNQITNAVPSDLILEIYVDGTPPNSMAFFIDNIEIFPTNQPFNSSQVRASLVEQPESYDGVTGFLSVNENDGFAVRSAFVIRENLYFVKEHGIYVTQDDGTNEPSLWKITEVSRKVGTISVNGVAVGEDWAVIADRGGLYLTTGGEPVKISQEIQPTWDRINWAAGQTLWVQVDLQNKRILVGVPLDGATAPSATLMLDYRGTNTIAELMDSGPIHTTYTGKLMVLEKSRKWSPWTITANSAAIVERFDGTQKVFLGNKAGNGKIYQLSDSQFSDDGAAIPSYYTTYYHYTHDLEQAFQIGSHNKLFTYMSQFVEGSGNLVVSAVPPGGIAQQIATLPLSNPSLRDVELPINVTAVRAAFKVATSNPGEWFRLARFIVNAIKSPSAPVRGWN